MLPPFAEGHAGFFSEEPLERSGADCHPLGHLFDQARIAGMRPQPLGGTPRAFIGWPGKLKGHCRHGGQLIQEESEQARVRRDVSIQRPQGNGMAD